MGWDVNIKVTESRRGVLLESQVHAQQSPRVLQALQGTSCEVISITWWHTYNAIVLHCNSPANEDQDKCNKC